MDEPVRSRRTSLLTHADAGTAKAKKLGLDLLIGSNLFRDTNGVVKIHGKEQLVLELRPAEGLLLLTMDLYSENGVHVAHLRRNEFALNRSGQFAIEIHHSQRELQGDHPWIRLLDRQSGSLVLETRVISETRLHILSGHFYSHQGVLVEITANYCRLGSNMTLFGEIVETRGGMVALGSDLSRPFRGRP